VNKKRARYETNEEVVTTQFISRTQHRHVAKENLVVAIGGRNSLLDIKVIYAVFYIVIIVGGLSYKEISKCSWFGN
jgi:hypothetical protein